MYLSQLKLDNFKNFEHRVFDFSPKINAFVGNNGIGKTNVLDAIYYLSFFKSYFQYSDANNVRFDEDYFLIEGNFIKDEQEDRVQCGYQKGQKKTAKRNHKNYSRLSEHIGRFPVVIISPYDRNLISEGSNVRRKFMDSIISQSDSVYLADLIRYNKVLQQRNALLKFFAANRTFDSLQLDLFDREMLSLGKKIHAKRMDFCNYFSPKFQHYFEIISKGKEKVEMEYVSVVSKNPDNYLNDSLEKDKLVQFSSSGIHKDDLLFSLKEQSVKSFGSQGQQKSYIIALKLAQLELIKERLGFTPILLLDDVFDKLDEERVAQIISLVNHEHFGQIFLSDTHADRIKSILNRINESHLVFDLSEKTNPEPYPR